jgi:hypothetical protein
VTTPEIVIKIHKLIFGDGWGLATSIAEQLGLSRERVGSIIHEDLDMRKISAKSYIFWGSYKEQCMHYTDKEQALYVESGWYTY